MRVNEGPAHDHTLLTHPSVDPEIAGARPAILATIYLGILVLPFTVPLGVATALYLEEYATRERWYNRFLEVNIQNLAGVPSIVYGILGLAVHCSRNRPGRVLLAGAIILTLLTLPTVIIASREAIRAVPDSIRQGGYALGATQWQVVSPPGDPRGHSGHRDRVDPRALAGYRRDGAALDDRSADVHGSFDLSVLGASPRSRCRSTTGLGSRRPSSGCSAARIIVLLVIMLVLNSVAIIIRNRYQKRW